MDFFIEFRENVVTNSFPDCTNSDWEAVRAEDKIDEFMLRFIITSELFKSGKVPPKERILESTLLFINALFNC